MAYPTLLWFAGYSNVSSVVIVILGFICMAIFIAFVSMNTDLYGPPRPLSQVEERNMVKVVNPFFLQLEHEGKSLKDGLKFHLSRLCPCKAVVLWGVHINNFHNFILEKGHEIRQKLLSEDITKTCQLDPLHQEYFEFSDAGDDTVSIPCPRYVNPSALGNIPRQRYPVTVLVFVPESPARACSNEEGGSECSNNIVCLISVIHLKDEYVPQSSHVIQQYIKTAGVPIYSLKPLFVNAPSTLENHERDDTAVIEGRQNSQVTENKLSNRADFQVQNTLCKDVLSSSTECLKKTFSSSKEPRDGDASSNEDTAATSPVLGSQSPSAVEQEQNNSAELREHGTIRRRKLKSSQCTSQNLFSNKSQQNDGLMEEDDFDKKCDNCEKQPSSGSDKSRSAECVVCQTKKDMCVLLPCRHVCVCYKCFKLLDRCPMCRSALESYFLFSSDKDETCLNSEDNEEVYEFINNVEQPAFDTSFLGRGFNAFI